MDSHLALKFTFNQGMKNSFQFFPQRGIVKNLPGHDRPVQLTIGSTNGRAKEFQDRRVAFRPDRKGRVNQGVRIHHRNALFFEHRRRGGFPSANPSC